MRQSVAYYISVKRERERFQLGYALAAREKSIICYIEPGVVNETFTFVLIGR